MKSEYSANFELAKMAREHDTARLMFNLSGDIARQALRNQRALHASGHVRFLAKLTQFFVGKH